MIYTTGCETYVGRFFGVSTKTYWDLYMNKIAIYQLQAMTSARKSYIVLLMMQYCYNEFKR
jgi:hypothetical protein